MVEDSERKCLLTPTQPGNGNSDSSFAFPLTNLEMDLDGDLGSVRSKTPTNLTQLEKAEMIYSEPMLNDPFLPYPPFAVSDTLIPNIHQLKHLPNFIPILKQLGNTNAILSTPRSSMCLSDASLSVVNVGRNHPNKASFSTREIREQHIQIQNKYRPKRDRHFTDPIDFEGILNIIGGCSWWQIWVYVLISMQQIPHAMFNLNVVYMMYQPEHWCQCHYYSRSEERFRELRQMNMEEAERAVRRENVTVVKCKKWHYKKDVMETTIVTDWDLVCDDNMKRGHAHLFYSFGFLIGCLLGGFASDSFGRKPTVIGFGVLSSMFGMFLPYTQYFPMFLFIRLCSAICNEAADLAAYILCMEITGVRYRAMVGSLLQAPWAVGYAFLALLAYFCKSWKTIQLVAAFLHFFAVLMICALPESPRWLMVIDRLGEAEAVIRKACRQPPFPFNLCRVNRGSLPSDLELVQHQETSKWVRENRKASIITIFKSPEMRSRSIIICVVFIATALVYYGVVIALSDQSAPGRVLFSGNFFVNNAIAGAIELPTLISCVYLMKFGRRRAQMITLNMAGVSILIAMGFVLGKYYMLALGFMLLGKIFVQGAFNILYIYTSELYPTVIRNSAVGLNSMIARFGSGVSSYISLLSDVTLPIVPMITFSILSLVAGILVYFLPETRDKPLPETFDDAVTLLTSENDTLCCGIRLPTCKSRTSPTDFIAEKEELEAELGARSFYASKAAPTLDVMSSLPAKDSGTEASESV